MNFDANEADNFWQHSGKRWNFSIIEYTYIYRSSIWFAADIFKVVSAAADFLHEGLFPAIPFYHCITLLYKTEPTFVERLPLRIWNWASRVQSPVMAWKSWWNNVPTGKAYVLAQYWFIYTGFMDTWTVAVI